MRLPPLYLSVPPPTMWSSSSSLARISTTSVPFFTSSRWKEVLSLPSLVSKKTRLPRFFCNIAFLYHPVAPVNRHHYEAQCEHEAKLNEAKFRRKGETDLKMSGPGEATSRSGLSQRLRAWQRHWLGLVHPCLSSMTLDVHRPPFSPESLWAGDKSSLPDGLATILSRAGDITPIVIRVHGGGY